MNTDRCRSGIDRHGTFRSRLAIGLAARNSPFILRKTVAIFGCISPPGGEQSRRGCVRRRFDGRAVTTGQIVIFGITGGLIPCPDAVTVLLLCLQFKRLVLGSFQELCFSVGLALTMVTSGVIAALSVKYAEKSFAGFGDIVRKAPYANSQRRPPERSRKLAITRCDLRRHRFAVNQMGNWRCV